MVQQTFVIIQIENLQKLGELKKINVPDGIYHISCADPKWYWSVTYEHDQKLTCSSFVFQVKKNNFPTHFKVINQPFVDRGTVSLFCPGTGQYLRQRPFNYCLNGFAYNRLCFDISAEMFGLTSDETEFVFYGAKNEESGENGGYKVIICYAGDAFVRVQKSGYLIASGSDPSRATVFHLEPRFDQKICECLFKN